VEEIESAPTPPGSVGKVVIHRIDSHLFWPRALTHRAMERRVLTSPPPAWNAR
jgi:hypothetical protein